MEGRQTVLFFELLQVAIGTRKGLDGVPTAEEWNELFRLCRKQGLLGIGFGGIQQLPEQQWPPRLLKLKWTAQAQQLEKDNAILTARCVELSSFLQAEGFWNCILKGQGNLAYYPAHLKGLRKCGDIDVWMTPAIPCAYPKRQVLDYVNRKTPGQFICYIHVDFPVWKEIPVEVHIRPSFLCAPFRNASLQQWFSQQERHCALQSPQGFSMPTVEFNVIYQLLHLYKHLFEEGIGLRQLLDYAFVLQAYQQEEQEGKITLLATLDSLGMRRFATAVMYILKIVFCLPDAQLLCAPDEEEGMFLLKEVLAAGNLGQHDERIRYGGGAVRHAWEKLKHNIRLIHHYPEEVLWEPLYRFWHWTWRARKAWRYE